VRVPILCYHRIEAPPASTPDDTNFVSPALFRRHLAVLASLGFRGVTVRNVLEWQQGRGSLPPRAIAVTFDDAYGSVVTHGLPALAAHGWPATVFAVSAYLGGTNAWDPEAPRATILDAGALRGLLVDGHEVGAHTRHHRRLRGLPADSLREELVGAREDLEQALGAPCESLAYPYGTHDRHTLPHVAAAGYRGACTLKRWANTRRTNPLRLGRMSVGGRLAPWALVAKLAKLYATPSLA
jgi:peptidoglycan/xylan/chitin deacetylase (PgdA/CDA1 family)